MRRLLLPLAFLAATVAAVPRTALADGDGATAAMRKLAAAKSYHLTIAQAGTAGGRMEMDYVAPDRFRMQTPAGIQHVIGDTMYMTIQGKTSKIAMPKGALTKLRDPANLAQLQADTTVTPLGLGMLDGRPARKYRLVSRKSPDTASVIWVGAEGWPLQIDVDGKQGKVTGRYSRFNDPAIKVDPPI